MLPKGALITDNNCDDRPRRVYAKKKEIPELVSSILGIPVSTCNIDHFDDNMYQIFTSTPSEKAISIRDRICATEHIQSKNFNVQEAPVVSACAVFDSNKRYILYNDDYLGRMTRGGTIKPAAYFVFAHEIAHFLNWNMYEQPFNMNTRRTDELAADEWSGRAMADMGYSRQETLQWLRQKHVAHDAYYPGKNERKKAILYGWQSSNVQQEKRYLFSFGGSASLFAGMIDVGDSSHKKAFYHTDASHLNTLDFYYHPQFGKNASVNKFLSHLALGVSYIAYYDILFNTYDTYTDHPTWQKITRNDTLYSAHVSMADIQRVLFTARWYFGNYFSNVANCYVSYSYSNQIQEYRFAYTRSLLSKRYELELFMAPTTFNITGPAFHSWKLLFGASANYCFGSFKHK